MMKALEAVNVSKWYGKTIALKEASLTLNQGEIHALLGPNGAGKTTLIKILATLLKKDKGQVTILGYDLDKNEREIRALLGYVGQDTERSAYARLTAMENLRFFGALRGLSKDEIDNKVHEMAEYFDFNGLLEKQFMHLSGGQKQAVIIMRAFLHDPPLIYLDEPTKGLDPITAYKIREFLKQIVKEQGKTMLLTSHILSEVDYLSDKVSLIHHGEIKITGTPDELKGAVGISDFIDLNKQDIPPAVLQRIKQLQSVETVIERDGNLISLGVADLFTAMEDLITVLKKERIRTNIKQHSVTLEDAFIFHIGELEEEFTR